ncbi:hypothetical protein DEO72_LG4g499 [Vigna unguiculata]|uniref:Uncharacterized protein n=1 Tax=Vigna unguiculata TaxID=3917 RepID=A0A4D6LM23_VIGUN|nr:hypothetical protein DEO72_LG4g499 [Vigna unguiculata]
MEVKIAFQNVTSYDYTVLFSFSDLASPESRVFVGSALKIATRVEVASPAMQILTVAREKPIVLTVEPLAAAPREKSTSHGVDVTRGHSAATLAWRLLRWRGFNAPLVQLSLVSRGSSRLLASMELGLGPVHKQKETKRKKKTPH